jgi:putative tryptophan/tyrosine transport system substrate-binding protein
MRRRTFIPGIGSVAAWPLAARAQQQGRPVVGFLSIAAPGKTQLTGSSFRQGLAQMGFVEGRNVTFEYREADGVYGRLPGMAADLVRRQVAVIVASGSHNATLAAKAATATIPIVFGTGLGDPVALGLVASLNRPGGNVTGVTNYSSDLLPKRLQLLRELVPHEKVIGFLTNPTSLASDGDMTAIEAAARSVGQEVTILKASTAAEIDAAFATAAQAGTGAMLVSGDNFFVQTTTQAHLAAAATRHRIPANYAARSYAEAGGLMSYGNDRIEARRQAGVYVGRILNGEKPADLPILQPTKFELVINLKTAKALGLTVPETLLATADEVIQ